MKRSLVALVLILSFCSADAETLTPGQAVRLLNRDRDSKSKVAEEDIRLEQPASFPGLVLIGFSKGNGTYILGSAVYSGRVVRPREVCAQLLAASGWDQADANERQRLARLWVDEVMLAFGEKVLEDPAGFAFGRNRNPEFVAPQSLSFGDGGIRLLVWVQEAQGEALATSFRRCLYQFSGSGELGQVRMLDRVVMPLE